MDFNSLDELKSEGFVGFKRIRDLFLDTSTIPKERGNYLVLYVGGGRPEFNEKGVGGCFKGKKPYDLIEKLESMWVGDTIVIYIGQAGGRAGKWSNQTLNDRICTYMKFGQGQNVAHRGGRYVWQIKNYKDLIICWKPWPNKISDPKQVEGKLIQQFKSIYGKRPFANLQD